MSKQEDEEMSPQGLRMKKTSAGESKAIRIVKKCPACDRRILDKVTPTTGTIELKCPHCHKIVEVNLALRRCCNHIAYQHN